jgi:hypothetical protein
MLRGMRASPLFLPVLCTLAILVACNVPTGAVAGPAEYAVVRGVKFAVLQPGMAPTATTPALQAAPQALPGGWTFANASDDTTLLAIFMFHWGDASGVVCADGSSWKPGGFFFDFERELFAAGNQLVESSPGMWTYNSSTGPQHVLISQLALGGEPQPDFVETHGEIGAGDFITLNGRDYGTIIPSDPAGSSLPCTEGWVEMGREWAVANDTIETRLAAQGATNFFVPGRWIIVDGGNQFRVVNSLDWVSGNTIPYKGNVFRGRDWYVVRIGVAMTCAAVPSVYLVSRRSAVGDSWAVKHNGEQMSEYLTGFDRFATLSNVPPGVPGTGCDGVLRAVPDGWELANSSSAKATTAAMQGWGTTSIVFANGDGKYTSNGLPEATRHLQSVLDPESQTTYYTVDGCARRILLHRKKIRENLAYDIRLKVLVLTPTTNAGRGWVAAANLPIIE